MSSTSRIAIRLSRLRISAPGTSILPTQRRVQGETHDDLEREGQVLGALWRAEAGRNRLRSIPPLKCQSLRLAYEPSMRSSMLT